MKSHARYGIPSYMLLVLEAPDIPQTTESIAIVHDCPLELGEDTTHFGCRM